MKIISPVNRLFVFGFIITLIASLPINANATTLPQAIDNSEYSKYYLDSNDNKYLVAINKKGNDLILYKYNAYEYLKVYQGDNYTLDGLYIIDNVSIIDNDLIINTYFNGSGAQEIKYYISNIDNKWALTKSEIRYNETKENTLRQRVCIDSNNKENCFYEVLKKSYLYDLPNRKSKMYLIKGDKITILKEKKDDNGQKWYFVNYKEKKEINMWIKADSVDFD